MDITNNRFYREKPTYPLQTEIERLRAENKRLRDLLAFNGINPDGKVLSAKGAARKYGKQ